MTYEEARKLSIIRDTLLSAIMGLLAALALRTDLQGISEYLLTWLIFAMLSDFVLIGLDPFIRHKNRKSQTTRDFKIYNMKKEGGRREC
jgi:hypothetical protein